MKLHIYKNQMEIEKTYEVEAYDLMYATVEDILSVFDELEDMSDNMAMLKVIVKNIDKLNNLILDIFPDMTHDELRKVKLKELVPFFMDLFDYVKESFASKN